MWPKLWVRRWHLGSLSDRGVGSPDCYPLPTSGPHNGSCQSGYWIKDGGCCFGIDDQTSLSHPLHFGFGAAFVLADDLSLAGLSHRRFHTV